MFLWYITKASRLAYDPYSGPAITKLGYAPCYFVNEQDAWDVAKRLSKINPVGFVVQVKNFKDISVNSTDPS